MAKGDQGVPNSVLDAIKADCQTDTAFTIGDVTFTPRTGFWTAHYNGDLSKVLKPGEADIPRIWKDKNLFWPNRDSFIDFRTDLVFTTCTAIVQYLETPIAQHQIKPKVVWDIAPFNGQQVKTAPGAPGSSSTGSARASRAEDRYKFSTGYIPENLDELVKVFGNFKAFDGDLRTSTVLADAVKRLQRPNTPPAMNINAWECRIGLCKFFIPPTSINVSEFFKSGSLGGGLRQINTMKFNSGYAETAITMTVIFPDPTNIWGYSGDYIDLDFRDPIKGGSPDADIDRTLSSLRGLIAQFKYTPFLPIRNVYLNSVFGIDAVALQNVSVQTIPGFPFAIAAQLTLLKFNFKPYLPGATDFHQAVHWGRLRQYLGRGLYKLDEIINKPFLSYFDGTTSTSMPTPTDDTANNISFGDPIGGPYVITDPQGLVNAQNNPEAYAVVTRQTVANIVRKKLNNQEDNWDLKLKLNKTKDLLNATLGFEIFYPAHDPNRIVWPDVSMFRDPFSLNIDPASKQKGWQKLLEYFGLKIDYNGADYGFENTIKSSSIAFIKTRDAWKALLIWLDLEQSFQDVFNTDNFSKFRDYYFSSANVYRTGSPGDNQTENDLMQAWLTTLYEHLISSPALQRIFYIQLQMMPPIIREWDIPMRQLGLNPDNVLVDSISVSTGNNFAKLQLQMEEEPCLQHIGGLDSNIDIKLKIFGEEDLWKIKWCFSQINKMARMEHNNAVLGFLGIKNLLTAMLGIKYIIPQSFEIETIPNYPHVYDVKLSFLDFDIFQQKREELSQEQQAKLIQYFGKRNPFLRIKQVWDCFNCYPDFPLSVREDTPQIDPETGEVLRQVGSVIGYLDPDYYFYGYQLIDEDVADWYVQQPSDTITHTLPPTGKVFPYEDPYYVDPATNEPNNVHTILVEGATSSLYYNKEAIYDKMMWYSLTADKVLPNQSAVGGLTPLPTYQNPYLTTEVATETPIPNRFGTALNQYYWMLRDAQYRDKAGQMIRAFPTYMLWLIQEGGLFTGIKLYDNFFGLQSVLDMSIVRSEDIMADVLQLRLSNVYAKLTTPFRERIDPNGPLQQYANIINTQLDWSRNLSNGLYDYLTAINTLELRPGMRIHLRLGYSNNPNALETVFNGVITEVEAGEIVTITAQSDAVEFSSIINNSDKNEDTGRLDGSLMSNLWLSEPRDLMITLLTQGASVFKEMIAQATAGRIFSENRFGIRHFGKMMYSAEHFDSILADDEEEKRKRRSDLVDNIMKASYKKQDSTDSSWDFFRLPVFSFWDTAYQNLYSRRDYEIFKRNIYPGNGIGLAQFMGGDIQDIGWYQSGISGGNDYGITPSGTAVSGAPVTVGPVGSPNTTGAAVTGKGGIAHYFGLWMDSQGLLMSLLGGAVGVGGEQQVPDDDLKGFDEISFRARTYMKSVWEIFELCAALLPNYIIAVRPFEERSTLFYGKPHWLYSSGLIPLSQGIDFESRMEDPDGFYKAITRFLEVTALAADKSDAEKTQRLWDDQFLTGAQNVLNQLLPSPSSTSDTPWSGDLWPTQGTVATNPNTVGGVLNWPVTMKNQYGHQISLSNTSGPVALESHLSSVFRDSSGNILTGDDEIKAHAQMQDSAFHSDQKWKGDWVESPGYNLEYPGSFADLIKAGITGPDGESPAKMEVYYINQLWGYSKTWGNGNVNPHYDGTSNKDYYGQKVAVINTENGKGVICAIMDFGPNPNGGSVAGISPDAMYHILNGAEFPGNGKVNVEYRFVPSGTVMPLGPFIPSSFGVQDSPSGVGLPPDVYPSGASAVLSASGTPLPGENLNDFALKLPDFTDWMTATIVDHAGEGPFKEIRSTEDFYNKWAAYRSPNTFSLGFGYLWTEVPPLFPTIPLKDKGYPGDIDDIVGRRAMAILDNKMPGVPKLCNPYFEPTSDPQSVSDLMAYRWNALIRSGDLGNDDNILKAYINALIFKSSGQVEKIAPLFTQNVIDRMNAFKADPSGAAYQNADGSTMSMADVIFDTFKGFDVSQIPNQEVISYLRQSSGAKIPLFAPPDESNSKDAAKGMALFAIFNFKGFTDFYGTYVKFIKELWTTPGGRAWVTFNGENRDALTKAFEAFVTNPGDNKTYSPGLEKYLQSVWSCDQVNDPGDIVDAVHGVLQTVIDVRDTVLGVLGPIGTLIKIGDPATYALKAIDWLITAGKSIADAFSAIFSIGTQVLNLLRSYMSLLWQGVEAGTLAQRRAQALNGVYDDSIYYSMGNGDQRNLICLADNPFTREYGEPVVEIREPFQKVHFINSFNHILANGIVENNGVATVVTGVSSGTGNKPVTVYFDKGAPDDRKIEKVVETNLIWDKPRGLLEKLLHPLDVMRSWAKMFNNGDDETSSRRVAAYWLKESLKDIYGGEIIIMGDPTIRPHDLIYIGDVYERIYGFVEVEQVVHHFTPEMGFITSITPNAVVTVSDPERWHYLSYLRGKMQKNMIRNELRRRVLNQIVSGPLPHEATLESLIGSLKDSINGDTQFTGGSAALVADIRSGGITGQLYNTKSLKPDQKSGDVGFGMGVSHLFDGFNLADSIAESLGIGSLSELAGGFTDPSNWGPSKWIHDWLLDQHTCQISYLTKNGLPMDAGLSANVGVAVGQRNMIQLFGSIIRLPIDVKNQSVIRLDDIFAQIGWVPKDVADLRGEADIFVNSMNNRIMEYAGDRLPTAIGPDSDVTIYFIKLTSENDIYDGDTIYPHPKVLVRNHYVESVRLTGINAPEMPKSANPPYREDLVASGEDPGTLARDFLRKILYFDIVAHGWEPWIAIRINNQYPLDVHGRALGTIFYGIDTTNADFENGQRGSDARLERIALNAMTGFTGTTVDDITGLPLGVVGLRPDILARIKDAYKWAAPIPWDAMMSSGQPYTANWAMAVNGYADVWPFGLDRAVAGETSLNPPDQGNVR